MPVLKILLFLILLVPLANHAQYNLLYLKSDTLKITERTGGIGIDSLDMYHTGYFTTNPGGPWNNPFGRFGNDYLNVMSGFQNQQPFPKLLASKFIALPHLGFQYSFGSKSLQYVHAEYQQTFRKNTHLNVSYNRNSVGKETGFIRNNSFSNDVFQFLIDHQGKKYENLVYLNFSKSLRGLSGGIRTDTLIENFGLEYSPVFKQNANSINRNLQLGSQHLYNLGKDSTVKHGFVYKNQWSIQNRLYFEVDSLKKFYDTLYIHKDSTRDQFQMARINNAGGYFFKSKIFAAEALIQHSYWKFQNLGRNRDTNEIEFQGNLIFNLNRFTLKNSSSVNLAGALGEWKNDINAVYKQKNWDHSAGFTVSQVLPTPFQRQYFSNTSNWKTANLKTQGQRSVYYNFHNKSKFDFSGQVGWKQLQNTYFLVHSPTGYSWRNDTLKMINLFSASLRGALQWKTLNLQPQVIVSSGTKEFSFIPQFDLRSKIFFNKKLFKAKKLDFIIGVDLRYQANYRVLAYDATLDLYRLPTENIQHKAMLELDFFTGIQIDEFRFYFKFENIDYFWNPQTNLQQLGYPVSPNIIRLGLTWDFFN